MFWSLSVVIVCSIGTLLLSWAYFQHYQIPRPPFGVFNLKDVAFMLGAVVVVPYLYLALPLWAVVGLLIVGIASILSLMWEPVLRARWAIWLATGAMLLADMGSAVRLGTTHPLFVATNNLVLVAVIVGLTNSWAQGGMKARDVAVLAGALAVYDFFATARLPLMAELGQRLASAPLSPQMAWGPGNSSTGLSIGLGDLLLAAVFPLVMRKAFGRPAGLAALALAIVALVTMLALASLSRGAVVFPAMAVLGPLTVAQYAFWARRCGLERARYTGPKRTLA
jgi:hypothetical protein